MLIPIFQILLQTRPKDTTAGGTGSISARLSLSHRVLHPDSGMRPNTQDESAIPLRVKENPHDGVENKYRHGSPASSLH